MKKNKKYLCIAIAGLSLLLSGCGTAMHELTSEEEELIVQYAAHFIAKHNIYQKDGVSNVIVPEEGDTETESVSETQLPEETETETETEHASTDNPDGTQQEDAIESIKLAEAIGHGAQLTITYLESEIAEHYKDGDFYSVSADVGKTFYTMKFKIENISDKTIELNNIKKEIVYQLRYGETSVKAENTFLAKDFTLYKGKIEAGQSIELMMLFEISKDDVKLVKEPLLQVEIEDSIKNIEL